MHTTLWCAPPFINITFRDSKSKPFYRSFSTRSEGFTCNLSNGCIFNFSNSSFTKNKPPAGSGADSTLLQELSEKQADGCSSASHATQASINLLLKRDNNRWEIGFFNTDFKRGAAPHAPHHHVVMLQHLRFTGLYHMCGRNRLAPERNLSQAI